MSMKTMCVALAVTLGLATAGRAAAQPMTIDVPAIKVDLEKVRFDIERMKLDMAAATIDLPSIAFAFGQDREKEAEQRERERETRAYEQGREYIDQGRYDRAIERMTDVVSMKGQRADAALYYKAWAQNKSGQRAEALATIAALGRDYPKSRYLTQAKALESEVRIGSGQPARPESENDEDLKLMAIQAMQDSDPAQAIPLLEKLLEGTASPKLKSRALFVLAQSSSPRAREVM
jgi:tetratricopeptide (TPR) repeat protein